MAHKQIEAIIMLDEVIKKFEGCENVYLAMEDAVALKSAIENHQKFIIELIQEIDDLKEDHNLMVEKILDKVRYLCWSDGNKLIIDKETLNTLERRLKGEE
jgi:RNA processing factor Prp31